MFTSKGRFKGLLVCILVWLLSGFAAAQSKTAVAGTHVLWEPVNISQRDLYWGAGGRTIMPVVKGMRLIGRDTGGNNLKYRVEDGAKRLWVVKIADESQPEVAANRLLWGIGYHTEIDYIVPKLSIQGVGTYKNARFELRPTGVERGERWSWMQNPFLDSRELDGLKLMMALINNWDLKDENTITFLREGKTYFVVSDLGASFGKLADKNLSRSGRSVSKPEHYLQDTFLKGVNNGILHLDYRGINENVVTGIKVENARWLVERLLQLSDRQLEDAFRAANYEPGEVATFVQALKGRIVALDRATAGENKAALE